MNLYSDKPISIGVENAIKRAKQMVGLKWTPIKKFPYGDLYYFADESYQRVEPYLFAHRPQEGVIYSSVRIHEKFVGDNVLFETFLSAVANPRSVVYTRPQFGLGKNMFNFYGTVCSSFAAYVLHLPVRVPCRRWPSIPGVTAVDTTVLENLQLCDALLRNDHIAIITDIKRDANGKVHYITVSESKPPLCVSQEYTPQSFIGYWLADGYAAYRYAGVHNVPYTPDPFSPVGGDPELPVPSVNKVLLPDYGNKANYMCNDTVELDILEEGWEAVRITGAAEITLPVDAEQKVAFTPTVPGYYTARCVNGEMQSEAVEFRATDMKVIAGKAVYSSGEMMDLRFTVDSADTPLGWIVHNMEHFWQQGGFLSEEEAAAGTVTIPLDLKPGEYYVFVMAEGRFGRYRSPGFFFSVKE